MSIVNVNNLPRNLDECARCEDGVFPLLAYRFFQRVVDPYIMEGRRKCSVDGCNMYFVDPDSLNARYNFCSRAHRDQYNVSFDMDWNIVCDPPLPSRYTISVATLSDLSVAQFCRRLEEEHAFAPNTLSVHGFKDYHNATSLHCAQRVTILAPGHVPTPITEPDVFIEFDLDSTTFTISDIQVAALAQHSVADFCRSLEEDLRFEPNTLSVRGFDDAANAAVLNCGEKLTLVRQPSAPTPEPILAPTPGPEEEPDSDVPICFEWDVACDKDLPPTYPASLVVLGKQTVADFCRFLEEHIGFEPNTLFVRGFDNNDCAIALSNVPKVTMASIQAITPPQAPTPEPEEEPPALCNDDEHAKRWLVSQFGPVLLVVHGVTPDSYAAWCKIPEDMRPRVYGTVNVKGRYGKRYISVALPQYLRLDEKQPVGPIFDKFGAFCRRFFFETDDVFVKGTFNIGCLYYSEDNTKLLIGPSSADFHQGTVRTSNSDIRGTLARFAGMFHRKLESPKEKELRAEWARIIVDDVNARFIRFSTVSRPASPKKRPTITVGDLGDDSDDDAFHQSDDEETPAPAPAPVQKLQKRCGKCKQFGHNARSCGKKAKSKPTVEEAAEPVQKKTKSKPTPKEEPKKPRTPEELRELAQQTYQNGENALKELQGALRAMTGGVNPVQMSVDANVNDVYSLDPAVIRKELTSSGQVDAASSESDTVGSEEEPAARRNLTEQFEAEQMEEEFDDEVEEPMSAPLPAPLEKQERDRLINSISSINERLCEIVGSETAARKTKDRAGRLRNMLPLIYTTLRHNRASTIIGEELTLIMAWLDTPDKGKISSIRKLHKHLRNNELPEYDDIPNEPISARTSPLASMPARSSPTLAFKRVRGITRHILNTVEQDLGAYVDNLKCMSLSPDLDWDTTAYIRKAFKELAPTMQDILHQMRAKFEKNPATEYLDEQLALVIEWILLNNLLLKWTMHTRDEITRMKTRIGVCKDRIEHLHNRIDSPLFDHENTNADALFSQPDSPVKAYNMIHPRVI
jgi:hypothetical protein